MLFYGRSFLRNNSTINRIPPYLPYTYVQGMDSKINFKELISQKDIVKKGISIIRKLTFCKSFVRT